MAIRTLKFALRYDPANSRAIGYHATQQNAAYNHAVDVLNREPELPKRSGKGKLDAMNKRITAWRQSNRQKADAPYYIHQQGAEEAWEANQRMRDAREERLERISEAIADGEEPKHRDARPHRRTLRHRSRKRRPLSLTITDRRLFEVSDDGHPHQSAMRFRRQATGRPVSPILGHPLHTSRAGQGLPPKHPSTPPALLPSCPSRRARAHAP